MKIVKVYDNNCEICTAMSQYDFDIVANLSSKPEYRTVQLSQILDPVNTDAEVATVAHYTELHAVNPDYTIDLPVYFVLEGKKYLGHLVGEQSQDELKAKLEKIVSGASNSKSKDHLFT